VKSVGIQLLKTRLSEYLRLVRAARSCRLLITTRSWGTATCAQTIWRGFDLRII